jgi:hypothetical protein
MAIAIHRDLDKTREQLHSWLVGQLPDASEVTVGEIRAARPTPTVTARASAHFY